MRRRLWIIDLALLGLVVLTAGVLRDRWASSRVREEALLRQMVPKLPPPEIPPLPAVAPSKAVNYLEVAQQFLFSRDRKPDVILDPPAPPPPPKPMPPLPAAYGVIDLGAGPTVILSERPGAPHKGYRAGEQIGEFKLVSVNSQEIVLEWEGKPVKRRLEELIDKSARDAEPAPAQTTAAQSSPAPAATSLAEIKAGPGVELGPTTRACVPNDTTPEGTVQDGYKKIVTKTPFGTSCRWEAVK